MIHDSDHERLLDSLPAYVLGALTGEERVEVEDHLGICPLCSGEYEDLAEAGMILALNVPPREPPARLKRRLMERVDGDLASPVNPEARLYHAAHRGRFARVGTIAQQPRFRYAAAAVARGDLDKAEKLIRAGANINAKFRLTGGQTTLTMAATGGSAKVVTWLLEHGAEPNAVTDSGRTALMQAAMRGNHDQVRVLLAHGADADISDKNGETALTLAQGHGHDEVAIMLEKTGAGG